MKKQTQAVHTPFPRRDPYGAIGMPIYHTVAYEFGTAEEMSDVFCGRVLAPDYSRVMNPTVTFFEEKVKALTGANKVFAFNSGMAAIANTFLTLAGAGKNVICSPHMFGNTFALLTRTLSRFGVETRICDLTVPAAVERAVDGNTCCIFSETVTNPQLEVVDLRALSAIADAHGIPFVADTTMIPFTEFSARDIGVAIEIVSSTKYLSGGATSLGGLVIDYGKTPGFCEKLLAEMLFNVGAYMTPHAAYMQTVGLESLSARYAVQAGTTIALAEKLRTLPKISRVNCIGLPDNPFYSLAQSQFGSTAGAILTIDLADRDACFRFINSLKLIRRATNLFDVKSLAIHPASTIFGTFSEQERRDMDVLDTTIRLSVGLEDVDDLFEDIAQALD